MQSYETMFDHSKAQILQNVMQLSNKMQYCQVFWVILALEQTLKPKKRSSKFTNQKKILNYDSTTFKKQTSTKIF